LTKYLNRQEGLELIILTSKGGGFPPSLGEGLDVSEIDSDLYSIGGNLRYAMKLTDKLREIERAGHIDIIHCLYPFSSLLGAVLFRRRNPDVKIVYDLRSPWIDMSVERGSIPKGFERPFMLTAYSFEKVLVDNVNALIFITEGLRDYYNCKISLSDKPYSVVPSGIDMEQFSMRANDTIRRAYGIGDDELVLGYAGGISHMRNLEQVIQGFEMALRARKDIRLLFVGDGDSLATLKSLSRRMGLDDTVIFTGKVHFDEVPNYISAMDIGLCHLPDKMVFRYSFPMKILEYLACGVQVLASNIHAHREIVRELDGITLYDDTASLASAILNARKREKKVPAGLARFNWTNISLEVRNLWEKVVMERFPWRL